MKSKNYDQLPDWYYDDEAVAASKKLEELVKFAHWVLKTYATTVSASCNQSNS